MPTVSAARSVLDSGRGMCLRDEVVEWESVCELAKHKVLVVGLCIDSSRASVLRFQTLYSPSFPVLHLPAAADMLRPPATPATVLVNGDGMVIAACAPGARPRPDSYARVRDLRLGYAVAVVPLGDPGAACPEPARTALPLEPQERHDRGRFLILCVKPALRGAAG